MQHKLTYRSPNECMNWLTLWPGCNWTGSAPGCALDTCPNQWLETVYIYNFATVLLLLQLHNCALRNYLIFLTSGILEHTCLQFGSESALWALGDNAVSEASPETSQRTPWGFLWEEQQGGFPFVDFSVLYWKLCPRPLALTASHYAYLARTNPYFWT